ncbi:hypothetical protein Ciccas_008994 [Cichlidogyrus casuarinus]|uniref:Uncharacterized protein n=1 Tax=Cichlidogyrus casuarinus TaxID=1844966 RepID=A0ABD2PYR2_9PLAT
MDVKYYLADTGENNYMYLIIDKATKGYNPESSDKPMLENLLKQTFDDTELVAKLAEYFIKIPDCSIVVKQEFQEDTASNNSAANETENPECSEELGDIIFAWNSFVDLSATNAKDNVGVNLLRNYIKKFVTSCPNHDAFEKALYETPGNMFFYFLHERLTGIPVILNTNAISTLIAEINDSTKKPTHLLTFAYRHKKDDKITYSYPEIEVIVKQSIHLIEKEMEKEVEEGEDVDDLGVPYLLLLIVPFSKLSDIISTF